MTNSTSECDYMAELYFKLFTDCVKYTKDKKSTKKVDCDNYYNLYLKCAETYSKSNKNI